MPLQEGDNLAPGAGPARPKLRGADAIGDVILHGPEHSIAAIVGL